MIYRPHFTYIAAATPEQTQAREAAANEEWRKRLIFHPIIVVKPSPPRPISLPRPPPNPPIHGIGRAPIYNPQGQPVVKRPIPEATEEQTAVNEELHPGFLLLPRLLLPRREPNPPRRSPIYSPLRPIGLPRPPPANPPIHGVARAPIYSPPRLYSPPRFFNPQNQEPEYGIGRAPIYNPQNQGPGPNPPERVTLEPLGRRLSIGIPQPTESPSPPQQTVAQESQSSKRLTTLLGRGLTDIPVSYTHLTLPTKRIV